MKHADPVTKQIGVEGLQRCLTELFGSEDSADLARGLCNRSEQRHCIVLWLSHRDCSEQLPGAVAYLAVDCRLFELFDINSNGTLSMQELTAGLSALCAGSSKDKARVVFDQYDADGTSGDAIHCAHAWTVPWYITSVPLRMCVL